MRNGLAGKTREKSRSPVLKGYADLGVPAWVILWHLATRQSSDGDKVQTALFGFLHMLEHELVKDFWKSAGRTKTNGKRNIDRN